METVAIVVIAKSIFPDACLCVHPSVRLVFEDFLKLLSLALQQPRNMFAFQVNLLVVCYRDISKGPCSVQLARKTRLMRARGQAPTNLDKPNKNHVRQSFSALKTVTVIFKSRQQSFPVQANTVRRVVILVSLRVRWGDPTVERSIKVLAKLSLIK